MGRVYLAFASGGRALAIKVVRAEHAGDEEFRRRFQREVAAAHRVQSRFTATVVDADPTAPLPWLATDYVPGPALRHAVTEHGPLPQSTVFRLIAGVAEGLAAVHTAGIIHRDLTPANVLLADDGPRVIDFGIAHAADATSLTRTGMLVGTPAFMAPEQVKGRSATPAVDVYALGSLAVFAATARPAFGEGKPEAVLYRIVNEPPDFDGCPPEVRAIAERCLAKDPTERPDLTEIINYAKKESHGDTTKPAESWLPPIIASTLSSYDPTPYRTKQFTHINTAGYTIPPVGPPTRFTTIHRVPRRRSTNAWVAGALIILALMILAGSIGLAGWYGPSWMKALGLRVIPPGTTTTTTVPPPTGTTPAVQPPVSTTTASPTLAPPPSTALDACVDDTAAGLSNTLAMVTERTNPANSAITYVNGFQQAANSVLAAANKESDAALRTALDQLAINDNTAAADVQAGDYSALVQISSTIVAECNALYSSCQQAIQSAQQWVSSAENNGGG
jgi:serine/threonine protein kinase